MTPLRVAKHAIPFPVLVAAFLFNLGQGVLRPSMPLYLQATFAANYTMVTAIPVVFGAGKWIANVPSGYLFHRMGRPLMMCGLTLIALVDLASSRASSFQAFLVLRALGGVGWAMFATVAMTVMVSRTTSKHRGRSVSYFMISETLGLLLGSASGGWIYASVGGGAPFLFEAACMIFAAAVVARWAAFQTDRVVPREWPRDRALLKSALRTPAVALMGVTSAVLVGIQTGVLVFLLPLFVVKRAGVSLEAGGFLVSFGVLGRLISLWFGGIVSDRLGRMPVLVPGLVIYAVALATMSWLTHPITIGITNFAIGVAAGFVASIPTALAADRVERSLHGVTIGFIRTMSDSGQIVGPLIMGALADAIDLSAPFLVGAVLLTALAVPYLRAATVSSAVARGREPAA